MAVNFFSDTIFNCDNFSITSDSTGKPEVFIKTTGNNNKPAILTFQKDKGAAGADDDGIGNISFFADNDAQQQTTFGNILYSVESATDGQEEGRINIGVAALNGGGSNSANVITGVGNGQNVTDVTIGLGATNVTTIAGTLTMGSTATLDNSGNLLTNAATATALTAGDKTISGDLTVTSGTSGDATLIISADTDNSEEGDSPRLWFKADGDITEGAIQHNDNTFDFISNVSSSGGFRFLTGTTNNTGTTDPSNGATERVSIDGTEMAINVDTNITGHLDITSSSASGSPLLRFNQTTTRRGFIQMADTNNNLRVASEYGSVSLEAASSEGSDSDTSYIRIQPGGTVEIGAVDGDATIATDGNMTFRIDADNDETSQKFAFQNNASTEIASLDESGNLSLDGGIELGNASDTTIARSAAGKATIEGAEIMTAGKGTGNIVNVILKDLNSYMFYLFNDDSWYSAGTGTLAILGSSTDPSAISSANSEYQSRLAAYIAPQACVVKTVTFTFYWSSSVVNSADIDFAFSSFTPISDGTAASIAMNKIVATDHNGSYTEVKPYSKTFTLSGGNASLAAGDAFAMHMRTTGGSASQRVLVYGTAIIEFELS